MQSDVRLYVAEAGTDHGVIAIGEQTSVNPPSSGVLNCIRIIRRHKRAAVSTVECDDD